jgi:hypothetical protein
VATLLRQHYGNVQTGALQTCTVMKSPSTGALTSSVTHTALPPSVFTAPAKHLRFVVHSTTLSHAAATGSGVGGASSLAVNNQVKVHYQAWAADWRPVSSSTWRPTVTATVDGSALSVSATACGLPTLPSGGGSCTFSVDVAQFSTLSNKDLRVVLVGSGITSYYGLSITADTAAPAEQNVILLRATGGSTVNLAGTDLVYVELPMTPLFPGSAVPVRIEVDLGGLGTGSELVHMAHLEVIWKNTVLSRSTASSGKSGPSAGTYDEGWGYAGASNQLSCTTAELAAARAHQKQSNQQTPIGMGASPGQCANSGTGRTWSVLNGLFTVNGGLPGNAVSRGTFMTLSFSVLGDGSGSYSGAVFAQALVLKRTGAAGAIDVIGASAAGFATAANENVPVVGYASSASLPDTGDLFVLPNDNPAVALYGFASSMDLVNTAVLDGAAVSPLSTTFRGLHAFTASGAHSSQSPATCVASNANAVEASASCSMRVTAAHTEGAESVYVTGTAGGKSARAYGRVWFPELRSIVLGSSVLRRMDNTSAAACAGSLTAAYEATGVNVQVALAAGTLTTAAVDVAPLALASGKLRLSSDDCAVLQTGDQNGPISVKGTCEASGAAAVTVSLDGFVGSAAAFTVSDDASGPGSLDLFVLDMASRTTSEQYDLSGGAPAGTTVVTADDSDCTFVQEEQPAQAFLFAETASHWRRLPTADFDITSTEAGKLSVRQDDTQVEIDIGATSGCTRVGATAFCHNAAADIYLNMPGVSRLRVKMTTTEGDVPGYASGYAVPVRVASSSDMAAAQPYSYPTSAWVAEVEARYTGTDGEPMDPEWRTVCVQGGDCDSRLRTAFSTSVPGLCQSSATDRPLSSATGIKDCSTAAGARSAGVLRLWWQGSEDATAVEVNISSAAFRDGVLAEPCSASMAMSPSHVAEAGNKAAQVPYSYPTKSTMTAAAIDFCQPGTSNRTGYRYTGSGIDSIGSTVGQWTGVASAAHWGATWTVHSTTGGSASKNAAGQLVASFASGLVTTQLNLDSWLDDFAAVLGAQATVHVLGFGDGVLPEPCAASITMSPENIAQDGDYATAEPFNIATRSSVSETVVEFCQPGTATRAHYMYAASGSTTIGCTGTACIGRWSGVRSAPHWGASWSVSSTINTGPNAGSATKNAASSLEVSFASGAVTVQLELDAWLDGFASALGAEALVHVLAFEVTGGQWCSANNVPAGHASGVLPRARCAWACATDITAAPTTIALAGSSATKLPFSTSDTSVVAAVSLTFKADSTCTQTCAMDPCGFSSDTVAMLTDERYVIESSDAAMLPYSSPTRSATAAQPDTGTGGSANLVLTWPGYAVSGVSAQEPITVVQLLDSIAITMTRESNANPVEACPGGTCALYKIACSDFYQRGQLAVTAALSNCATDSCRKDITPFAAFGPAGSVSGTGAVASSSGLASVTVTAAYPAASAATAAVVQRSAGLGVSFAGNSPVKTIVGVTGPPGGILRGREKLAFTATANGNLFSKAVDESSSGGVVAADARGDSVGTSIVTHWLRPTIELQDGTEYSFASSTYNAAYGLAVSDVLGFAATGCLDGTVPCTGGQPVTVDATGFVELVQKHSETIDLTVSALGGNCAVAGASTATAATVPVIASMDASAGDMDIGDPTGVTYPALGAGDSWDIPIYINTGSDCTTVRGIDALVFVPTHSLTVTGFASPPTAAASSADPRCSTHAAGCWPKDWNFQQSATVAGGQTTISIQGDRPISTSDVRLGVLYVGTVTVEARTDAVLLPTSITGQIVDIWVAGPRADSPLYPFGKNTPMLGGAGTVPVPVPVSAGGSRRRLVVGSGDDGAVLAATAGGLERKLMAAWGVGDLDAAGMVTSRDMGIAQTDGNGDGETNMLDAAFVGWLATTGTGSMAAVNTWLSDQQGMESTTEAWALGHCDPTLNGGINANDYALLTQISANKMAGLASEWAVAWNNAELTVRVRMLCPKHVLGRTPCDQLLGTINVTVSVFTTSASNYGSLRTGALGGGGGGGGGPRILYSSWWDSPTAAELTRFGFRAAMPAMPAATAFGVVHFQAQNQYDGTFRVSVGPPAGSSAASSAGFFVEEGALGLGIREAKDEAGGGVVCWNDANGDASAGCHDPDAAAGASFAYAHEWVEFGPTTTAAPATTTTAAPATTVAPAVTAAPTAAPTTSPITPTGQPTAAPTAVGETWAPTMSPTGEPTAAPTANPTADPTVDPTAGPTATPTAAPTADPTVEPTPTPTAEPTAGPTGDPTAEPSAAPTPTATADEPVRVTAALRITGYDKATFDAPAQAVTAQYIAGYLDVAHVNITAIVDAVRRRRMLSTAVAMTVSFETFAPSLSVAFAVSSKINTIHEDPTFVSGWESTMTSAGLPVPPELGAGLAQVSTRHAASLLSTIIIHSLFSLLCVIHRTLHWSQRRRPPRPSQLRVRRRRPCRRKRQQPQCRRRQRRLNQALPQTVRRRL